MLSPLYWTKLRELPLGELAMAGQPENAKQLFMDGRYGQQNNRSRHITIALHSTPGVRFVYIPGVAGPARESPGVKRIHAMSSTTKRTLIIGGCAAIALAVLLPVVVHDDRGFQHEYCINNLRQIYAAKQMWSEERHAMTNDTPTWDDLRDYLKPMPWKCPNGGTYTIGRVGAPDPSQ